MKLLVVGDQLVEALAGRVDEHVERGDIVVGHHLGGQGRGGRFEDPAHLEQVPDAVVTMEIEDEGDRVEQDLWLQTRHVRTVSLPYVQHPDQRQRLDGLPQRVAGQPQPLGEIGLLRQPVPGATLHSR